MKISTQPIQFSPAVCHLYWSPWQYGRKAPAQELCQFAIVEVDTYSHIAPDAVTRLCALAQHMLAMGYLLAPGALFHARRQPTTLMRINFATTQDARFWNDFQTARSGI